MREHRRTRLGKFPRRDISWPANRHPRTCGEHDGRAAAGSSPHVQNIHGSSHPPARAGNIAGRLDSGSSPHVRGIRMYVHPRTCGEHALMPVCHENIVDGSSPHVRGNIMRQRPIRIAGPVHPRTCGEHTKEFLLQSSFTRFIPARAGNIVPCRPPFLRTVHPRTCGGTLVVGRSHAVTGRFIPARAGNIACAIFTSCSVGGSSPHVRGTCGRK